MSVVSRITGLLESFQRIELNERDRYGAGGEDEVEVILRAGGWQYVRNPLVSHPSKPGIFLEADFLVHSGDALVVVEVKKLVGRISFEGEERKLLRQVKESRYREGAFIKRFGNPIHKTNNFGYRLRNHLATIDPRFQGVRIDASSRLRRLRKSRPSTIPTP